MRPSRRPASSRRQVVTATAAATGLAMLVLTGVLQVVLAQTSRASVDRVLEDRAEAVVSAVVQGSGEGDLTVPASAVDVGVVVLDGAGAPVAGEPPGGAEAAYARLEGVTGRTYADTQGLRLVAEPYRTGGGLTGVVVVPERLAPYRQAERYALLVGLVTGAVATAAAAAVAAVVMTRTLRPVAYLAATAREWSESDLSRRFDLGPPAGEITALAAVLDGLLDKVTRAIRSEQQLTSELAHELRTPLTTVQATADLCLMREDLPEPVRAELEELATVSRRMATTISTLLDTARPDAGAAGGRTPVGAAVDEALESLRRDRPDVHVVQDVPGLHVATSHDVLVRILAPLLDNASRFAAGEVAVTGRRCGPGTVEVVVQDDGPGVPGDDLDRVFDPGVSTAGGSGAGLGLPLSRRLARGAGGEVTVARAGHPARLRVVLPEGSA